MEPLALNLTGSRFASLCYLADKPEQFDVYLQNLVEGQPTPIPVDRLPMVQHGQTNERVTLNRLQQLGLTIRPQYRVKHLKETLVFDRPVGAKSDGLYKRIFDEQTREYGILEITQVHTVVPPYYLAQIILEMKACKRRHALFVSHFNMPPLPEELRVFHVPWDDALWDQCVRVFERFNLWTPGSATQDIRETIQHFQQWAVTWIQQQVQTTF
jgi:hypothetical protein